MKRPRVLIVDDDVPVLDSLEMGLEDCYDVLTARNGREALELLARQRVDAIVLDLFMPVMDGEAFLRRYVGGRRDAPVILASAAVDLERRAERLGVSDFLCKPFELSMLEEKLEGLTGAGTCKPAE